MQTTFEQDCVRVTFTRDEYDRLMILLGYATGAAAGDKGILLTLLRFVNAINRGNPNFTPYKVPEA
jgi:hypothetical protein